MKDLKHYKADFKPDVVFARGGFDEYRPVLKRYKNAFKIFYGAGHRYLPEDHIKYDLVLVDSEMQLRKCQNKGLPAQLWYKPVAPLFRPMPEIPKEFDVCYVGDGRFPFRAKIKNVNWVYKTVPPDLKLLHLGWSGAYKPPPNVTVRRVQRQDMPAEYARCKVGIVPYTSYDSAPRVIPEMIVCGLNVVVADEVNSIHNTARCPLDKTWDTVREYLKSGHESLLYPGQYSIGDAANSIRSLIDGL
jgi:hypothetical protein